ncbi:MAG: IclR family transcriptional regulator C-terminal domain-containing protein, partial [Pseudomonadota bacterium]
EQENERGIICFGAAIRDRTQAPVAAISVSVPMFRLNETRGYEAAILRAADEISKGLSFIDA